MALQKKKRLTPIQIKIYGYIYSWNEAGYLCEVSIIGIKDYLICSHTTIEVGIKKLEKLGWISIDHGKRPDGSAKNKCNVYTIKRKPKATVGTDPAVKPEATLKLEKSEAEKNKGKVYAITRLMNQLGIAYDTKKSIESTLLELI